MRRVVMAVAGVGAVLVVAGCGGGGTETTAAPGVKIGGLPAGTAMTVGDATITRAQLDRAMGQLRAQTTASGQAFPSAGSAAYTTAVRQTLDSLFLTKVVQIEAGRCGTACNVSDAAVDGRIAQVIKASYGNSRARFDQALVQAKTTLPQVRQSFRVQLAEPKLYAHVTAGIHSSEAAARRYYQQNNAQFRSQAGRRVYHILVHSQALAEKIAREATPANFGALARRYSTDGTRTTGGDLGLLQANAFVPEFQKVAATLKPGTISKPVKTQYGWHVIYVRLQKASVTPFSKAKGQILSSLTQSKKSAAWSAWQTKVLTEWRKRSRYASLDLVPASELVTAGSTTAATPQTATTATTTTTTTTGGASTATGGATTATGPATP